MPEEDDEEAVPHILPDQQFYFWCVLPVLECTCFRALTHIDMCSAATELVYINYAFQQQRQGGQSWPCDGLFVRTWCERCKNSYDLRGIPTRCILTTTCQNTTKTWWTHHNIKYVCWYNVKVLVLIVAPTTWGLIVTVVVVFVLLVLAS